MEKNIIKPGLGHLDSIYSKFVYKTVPLWNKLKISPNILTTFGLVCSLACVYFIYKKNAPLAILFLLLRMYFDYADGITARRYNQTTKLGDWYDHIVDIFGFTIPLLIVLSLPRDRWLYLVPVIIFMIATVINIGCIEKSYNKQTDGNGGDSLKIAEKLCFAPEVFRWLDNSVLYIVIIVIIILYSHA